MEKWKKASLALAIVLVMMAIAVVPAWAEGEPDVPVPTLINYQGYLTDNAGNPINGTLDITFSIYPTATGGTAVWTETQSVIVNDRLFNVLLGSVNPIDTSHLTGTSYLGVRVGTDPEMTPRQRIASVGYALQSDEANDANTLDGMDSDQFVLSAGDTMTGPLTVEGVIESTTGGFKFPDGTTQTTAAGGDVKQMIKDFVVASGESVTAGDVVSFVEGYVQEWSASVSPFGSEYVFNSAIPAYTSAVVLSSTKFVVAYMDDGNSGYGTAVIGDVSGTSITWGSEYVFNSDFTLYTSAAALSSTYFVVAYGDGSSSYGTAVIGKVSGTSITWGSEYVFNSDFTVSISAAALSPTQFVVAYRDWVHSHYGTAVIGDVLGTSITFGPKRVFNAAITSSPSAAALSSTKFVVAYTDDGNSSYGAAVIGDVSSSAITFGSEYVFNSASTSEISAAALSSTRFVVAYRDNGYLSYGTAMIGDVSGTSITWGSEYVFNSVSSEISAAALSSTRFVVAYNDSDNSGYGTAVIGDVAGASITWGSEYVFNSFDTVSISAAALSSTKFVVAYDDQNSDYGTAVIGYVDIDSSAIGIARESKTAGQTVPVIIGGVSDVHSGLSPGVVYYLGTSGNLTTSITDVRIGLAISTTEILLDSDRDNEDQFFGDMVFANDFRITEAGQYNGLILKNQLGGEVLTVDEEGDLSVTGSITSDRVHVNDLMRLEPSSGPPASPSAGDIYFDSNDHKLKCYDGTTWHDLW